MTGVRFPLPAPIYYHSDMKNILILIVLIVSGIVSGYLFFVSSLFILFGGLLFGLVTSLLARFVEKNSIEVLRFTLASTMSFIVVSSFFGGTGAEYGNLTLGIAGFIGALIVAVLAIKTITLKNLLFISIIGGVFGLISSAILIKNNFGTSYVVIISSALWQCAVGFSLVKLSAPSIFPTTPQNAVVTIRTLASLICGLFLFMTFLYATMAGFIGPKDLVRKLAIIKKDPTICKMLPSKSGSADYECIRRVAVKSKDQSICDYIPWATEPDRAAGRVSDVNRAK